MRGTEFKVSVLTATQLLFLPALYWRHIQWINERHFLWRSQIPFLKYSSLMSLFVFLSRFPSSLCDFLSFNSESQLTLITHLCYFFVPVLSRHNRFPFCFQESIFWRAFADVVSSYSFGSLPSLELAPLASSRPHAKSRTTQASACDINGPRLSRSSLWMLPPPSCSSI